MGAIYCITNLNDGRATAYIGSTSRDIETRWDEHIYGLRAGTHHNTFLQNAWLKYGEKSFVITLLETVSDDNIAEREQRWLDIYRETGRIYNFGDTAANSFRGQHHTSEAREKISTANRGRDVTQETRDKIASSLRGRMPSAYTMQQASRGLSRYFEVNNGHSDAAREAMSKAARHSWSIPSVRQRRVRATANIYNKEWRHKVSKTLMGHAVSEETRSKMSAAAKARTRNPAGRIEMARRGSRQYPSFQNIKTGEVIPSGRNLTALCRRKGLSVHAMRSLIRGRQKQHHDWIPIKEV